MTKILTASNVRLAPLTISARMNMVEWLRRRLPPLHQQSQPQPPPRPLPLLPQQQPNHHTPALQSRFQEPFKPKTMTMEEKVLPITILILLMKERHIA